MNVGTKSILFGVHAFWWHPFTVALAWRKLYGKWPDRYEWCAIFCHDLGYWGCPNMDGKEGRQHPVLGAKFAGNLARWVNKIFGPYWFDKASGHNSVNHHQIETAMLSLFHSREYSRESKLFPPSRLCWADKFCCFYDPTWFYLLRAHLSGEIYEFRANARGMIPDEFSCADWYRWYRLRILWLDEIQSLLALRRHSRQQSCVFPL